MAWIEQIIRFYSIPADTETVAPLDDLLGELVQILPAKIDIAEITVKIGHREYYPVTVLRVIGQVISCQDRRLKYARAYCILAFQLQIC